MKGYWAIRKWEAGPCGETIKFWVPGRKPGRLTRQAKSDIRKAAQNAASGIKQLARILNANFREGDGLLTLTYSDQSLERLKAPLAAEDEEELRLMLWDAARKNLQNAIRRARRKAQQMGIELKYVAITADLDEHKGELRDARVHHHLIADEQSAELILKAWKDGSANLKKLSSQPDYTPIAAYLMRQVRHVEDAKKFCCSKNLTRPQPEDRIAKTGGQIRPPKGAVLLEQGACRPGEPQYIRYILPKEAESGEKIEDKGLIKILSCNAHRRLT